MLLRLFTFWYFCLLMWRTDAFIMFWLLNKLNCQIGKPSKQKLSIIIRSQSWELSKSGITRSAIIFQNGGGRGKRKIGLLPKSAILNGKSFWYFLLRIKSGITYLMDRRRSCLNRHPIDHFDLTRKWKIWKIWKIWNITNNEFGKTQRFSTI